MKAEKGEQLRRDAQGRAFAGSQLQVQIYVNRRGPELDRQILAALAQEGMTGVSIKWVSPLEAQGFAEYMDGKFLRQLGLDPLVGELKKFWPKSGPRWDGLAILVNADAEPAGYLLVEGKSYPDEVFGSGCQSPVGTPNRKLIDDSLNWTKQQLRPEGQIDWTGRLYQSANRLAHVLFLQSHTGMPVWLANLCFTLDPRTPWSEADFQGCLKDIKRELGWPAGRVPHALDIFLPARDRSELLAP